MTESLLQNCTEVNEYPYPHVNIENALSKEYYAELYQTLPKWSIVSEGKVVGNGRRRNFSRDKTSQLSEQWREFLEYHESNEFYQEWISWFGPFISHDLRQRLNAEYGKLENLSVGNGLKVVAFIGINGPLIEAGGVRDAHLDKPNHFGNGLFYMAHPKDKAGGDFQMYECQGKPVFGPVLGTIKGGNVRFPVQKIVASVPYEPNRYTSFLATDKALHGVAKRSQTRFPRTAFATSFVCDKNIVYDK